MFKRVSHFEWRQREDVRLRVARLRASMRAYPDRDAPVSLSRALWRRPTRTTRHFLAISGLFRRWLVPGLRRRD